MKTEDGDGQSMLFLASDLNTKRNRQNNEILEVQELVEQVQNSETNADWYAVRNHIAFRAEKSLGHIAWGWGEADVYLISECCILLPDMKTKPKLGQKSRVSMCNRCDAYQKTDVFSVRHLLLKHLQWPTKCGRCRKPMVGSISNHECAQRCPMQCLLLHTKRDLVQHMYMKHGKFYCELCEKIFTDLREMKKHMAEENLLLVQSCILCKEQFGEDGKDGRLMKEHLLLSHDGFEDEIAGYEAAKLSNPEIIKEIYLRYKPSKTETYQFDNFQCPHCQRLFSARAGLKIHVGIAHRGVGIVFCPRCPFTFKNVDDCKVHLKMGHSVKKSYIKKPQSSKSDTVKKSVVPNNVPMCNPSSSNSETTINMTAYVKEKISISKEKVTEQVIQNNTDAQETQVHVKTENLQVDGLGEVEKEIVIDEETFELKTEIVEPVLPSTVETKKKVKKPLPGLLKITFSDTSLPAKQPQTPVLQNTKLSTGLKRKADFEDKLIQKEPYTPKFVNISTKLKELQMKMKGGEQRQLKPILPKPVVSSACVPRMPLSATVSKEMSKAESKTFIPVVGPDGKTMLINVSKAKDGICSGSIKFLPNNQHQSKPIFSESILSPVIASTSSLLTGSPLSSAGQTTTGQITNSPTLALRIVSSASHVGQTVNTATHAGQTLNPATRVGQSALIKIGKELKRSEIFAPRQSLLISNQVDPLDTSDMMSPETVSSENASSIMRDKVALNLPVVLTKRTNKKMAQDNPFFKISMIGSDVVGTCRVCQDFTKTFNQSSLLEKHFEENHQQMIYIKRFVLYYEISFKQSPRSRKKFFLCFYCGKEFTTKFNVRRHQMLYCPHKQEIDPRLLGLGPQDCAKTAELEWKKKEMLKTGGKCIEVVDDEEEVEILEKLEEERTVRVNVNEDNDGIEFLELEHLEENDPLGP